MKHGGMVEFDFVEDSQGGRFVASATSTTAVTALLNRGDVHGACRLYEEMGSAMAGDLIMEMRSASANTRKNLAEMFALARDFGSAARVHEMDNSWQEAAAHWQRAGDHQAAARAHTRAGDKQEAAAAFERDGQLDAALNLYEQSGDEEGQAEVLARQERFAEAAQIYARVGNLRGEVEMLRLVPNSDPVRVWAVRRLVFLLEKYGYKNEAVQLLVDTMQHCPPAQADAEIPYTLLRLLQELGRHDNAQRVQEFIDAQQSAPQSEAPALAQPETTTEIPKGALNPFGALRSGTPDESTQSGDAAYGYLKAIPIFAELDLSDMRSLYRISEELVFAPQSTLIEQGMTSPGLAVIVEGQVDVVVKGADGAEKKVNALGPGATIGEISLVRDAPTSARVVATSEVRALTIPRDRFQRYLYNHEHAALRIYRLFTQNLADRVAELTG
jgi:tetratricopeptide (TPR) repeat protein